MTEPVSLVASVLTIATAAGQIGRAISRLRHFGEVPSQVFVLKNEVTDLEVVLHQVRCALEQKIWAPNNGRASLEDILSRAKFQLAGLADALERVANTLEAGKVKIISRNPLWWKWKTLFQSFRDDIRTIKENLIVLLGASNL